MVQNVTAPAVGAGPKRLLWSLFRKVRKYPNFQETDAFSGT
ncbi:hypothetical protein GA0061099_10011012 [Bradyrhizobium yuanmingense]|uniref:Uncharacterized protein n=1 Tax=Bradyrhizobium yuanmingense TaxID=108015 RepID=A0A1C3UDT7_9BRAD|nr:hypothetical protein IQ15_06131 [Bradyrhizobium yuanmingense]SCB13643.1 hypothetical protein GA0061099_10011012 [Bradyrhizobium yuanmingense]